MVQVTPPSHFEDFAAEDGLLPRQVEAGHAERTRRVSDRA